MKNIISFILIIFLISTSEQVLAQVKPSPDSTAIKNAIDSVLGSFESLKQDIKALSKQIEKDHAAEISDSIILNEYVRLYDENNNLINEKLKIDKATIITQDGYIIHVVIKAGNFTFTNGQAPIALTAHRTGKKDRLYDTGENSVENSYYIIYQHALDFTGGRSYAPDDTTLVLTPANKTGYFKKGTMLNAILDLRLYTDALGLLGNKANGIVQIDARAKYFIHQSNCNNIPLFLAHYINTNINLEKFDSKTKYVDSANFSRSSILQHSWFNADLSINVIEWLISGKSANILYWDFGGSISAASLAKKTDSTQTILSPNIYSEVGINIKSFNNYGCNFNIRALKNYSPQTILYDSSRNKAHLFMRPSFEAWYNPFGSKVSRVFTRVNYWIDTTNLEANQKNFFQFQFGYATTLSKIK